MDVGMPILRRRFSPSMRGATLRSLITMGDRLGMTARALKIELEDIGALAFPAVLHWDLSHYVVVEAVRARKALIHDPSGFSGWMPLKEVSRHFTGIALELQPRSDFQAVTLRQQVKLSSLWTHVHGLKRAVGQTLLLSLILQAFALTSPYYLQLAVDSVLPQLNMGLLSVLAIGFGLFAILNGVATILRQSVLLSVGSSFGYGLSSNVARKLFRLPVDWFSRRHVGDILSRFQSVVPIRTMLAEDAPATLVDGVLAALTLGLMILYSAKLAAVALIALTIYALARVALFGPQRRAEEGVLVAVGREQSVLIESVQGIRPLRLAGRESLRLAVWQSRMTDAVNGQVRSQRLANWLVTLQTTIFALENVVSIWIAIGMVMAGGFSLGMVFAFLSYKMQFTNAATSLIGKAADFKMLGLHLDRLSDIVLEKEDASFTTEHNAGLKLAGAIELREVFYRYGTEEPFVLRGVNLSITSGESVAITGPSGGGKTTLLQVLLGLTQPSSGEVLIDGMPLSSFGYQTYHSQLAAVLQDDILFGGSLNANISLFDDQPDFEQVVAAATAAAIHDDIILMPMGYETLVGEMGSSLSGGQRQRVLLARALYRKPRILIMDEGTSHLDEANERRVNQAIAELGITRIIVAHRRETIASADRVLLLKEGVLEKSASLFTE